MVDEISPSPVIEGLLDTLTRNGLTRGILAATARLDDFDSKLEADLTGLSLDPIARAFAEDELDRVWGDARENRRNTLRDTETSREVIIGAGYHAAVYAASRVRAGFERPLVLDRAPRVGGVFGGTREPTFYLNSRNRPGDMGPAGDVGASLNHIPGAVIQPANVSMAEYQTNADMAWVIRLTLAQFADVIPDTTVTNVDPSDGEITINEYGSLFTGRIIDARGLGSPTRFFGTAERSDFVDSFPEFMERMAEPWPLRGLRRVAVIGGGDSAKCAVESLMGLAPSPMMACAALDHVERVDWYALNLPTDCENWLNEVRGRYAPIGRFLRPDRFGTRRLQVINQRVVPAPLSNGVVVDGRTYDLAVACLGNVVQPFDDIIPSLIFFEVGNEVVARYEQKYYQVGPCADLPFNSRELRQGINLLSENLVAMFRTGLKTALLAATLPAGQAGTV